MNILDIFSALKLNCGTFIYLLVNMYCFIIGINRLCTFYIFLSFYFLNRIECLSIVTCISNFHSNHPSLSSQNQHWNSTFIFGLNQILSYGTFIFSCLVSLTIKIQLFKTSFHILEAMSTPLSSRFLIFFVILPQKDLSILCLKISFF